MSSRYIVDCISTNIFGCIFVRSYERNCVKLNITSKTMVFDLNLLLLNSAYHRKAFRNIATLTSINDVELLSADKIIRYINRKGYIKNSLIDTPVLSFLFSFLALLYYYAKYIYP